MNFKLIVSAIVITAFVMMGCNSGDKAKDMTMKTKKDSMAYALGLNFGYNFGSDTTVGNMMKPELEFIIQGIRDGFAADTSKIGLQNLNKYLQELQTAISEEFKKKDSINGIANLAEGKKFLESIKAKEGVVETPSGLLYEVIKEGSGKKPTVTDKVKVHYHGTLTNGEVFDSSIERGQPAEFVLSQVIKGWTEGLQLMSVGSKYKLYIKPELGYGARSQGKIPSNAVLIFEVELLDILPQEAPAK